MGFGTLFIGYFLLLNITNYPVSDALAGLIMLLGLIKLSKFNRGFARAKWCALVFTVLGVCELLLLLAGTVMPDVDAFYDNIYGYAAAFRTVAVAALTLLMLQGMEEISREVELEKIAKRCHVLSYTSLFVFGLWILLELPLGGIVPPSVQMVLYVCAIVLLLLLLILLLATIYGCYMRICMPDEQNGRKQKPSRFKFINEYRQRQEQKAAEEAEYRRELMAKRAERKKKRK